MGRSRAGRKRQPGKRYPGGKLIPARDTGTPETKARRAMYAANDAGTVAKIAKAWQAGELDAVSMLIGDDGSGGHSQSVDAVGRAWAAGLLEGHGKDGAALRDAGRRFAKLYWIEYAETNPKRDLYREMVGRGSVSGAADNDAARARALNEALNRMMEAVDRRGHKVRRAFDQLCVDLNPDFGPAWLDRIILGSASGSGPATPLDRAMLDRAIEGLLELV